MITINDIKFYDVDFVGTGGGGVNYLNGGIFNKLQVVMEIACERSLKDVDLEFVAADKTITYNPANGYYNFIEEGWAVGRTIEVTGTGSNDGTYTIAAVTPYVVTVVEALTDESATNCNVYDTTPVTDIDLLYNLLANGVNDTYRSLTDTNALQRFTATGLDASDTMTEVSFSVNSNSYGWVTNNLTGADTNSEVKIVGDGITDFVQSFIITQTFTIAPFWIAQQFNNLVNGITPDIYPLRYLCQIDARNETPEVIHTGGVSSTNGIGTWFDANNIGGLPDVYVSDITYQTADGAVEKLDFTKENTVRITLNSRSSCFANSPSETIFAVDFFYAPLNSDRYTATETTLRQNLLNDRVVINTTSAATDGQYFGTDYQVLKDVVIDDFSSSQLVVELKIDFATAIKDFLTGLSLENRCYGIVVTTQDIAVSTTAQSSRVSVLCDFQNMTYDPRNADLLEVGDFVCYSFPQTVSGSHNNLLAMSGQPCIAQMPFQVLGTAVDGVTPTLMSAGMAIVMAKEGEDDFVLEQYTFDASQAKKINGIQTIDSSVLRGYVTYDGDPFNIISLQRNEVGDSGDLKGFVLSYAFVPRYEYWYSITPNPFDLENATEYWKELVQDGWEPKVRFNASVKGYDDFITEFDAYTDLTIQDGEVTVDIKYYNETGYEVGALLKGTRTLIQATFTGDLTTPSGFDNLYGFLFVDYVTTGGTTKRRTASSINTGESDTPFTAGYADPDADFSYTGNATLNVYINPLDPTDITAKLLTWYDETVDNWGVSGLTPLVVAQAGFYAEPSFMAFEDGDDMEFEDETLMVYNS